MLVRYFVLVLLASLHTTGAIMTTVCDCSNERKDGFIAFDDEDCLLGSEDPAPPKNVTYTLYSHLPEVKRFPGHVCRMWAVTRSIFTDFFGWHYTTESKWAVPVSTSDCEEMRDLRKCKNETMYAKGSHKYTYDVIPSLQPVWMTKRWAVTFHCKIAEVALESECDNCTINSPVGTIEFPYNGSVTKNLQTLIWEDAYKEKKPCDLKLAGESVNDGLLYKTHDPKMRRLQDRISQTDYLVNVTKELERCGKSALFSINGMEKILIVINIPTPELYTSYASGFANATEPLATPLLVEVHSNGSYDSIDSQNTTERKIPASLAAEIKQAAHHQYTRDLALDQVNRLANEIRRLQCENRKATRNSILLSAKNDGWYAATQLQLPSCSRLTVYGAQVEVARCAPFNVSFGAERTKCGNQPRFMNFTIAHNGWQLVPYHPCYWPEPNYVNFNGKTHIYADGGWVPFQQTADAWSDWRRMKLIILYKIFANESRDAKTGPLSHASVMADILASIHEHYAEDNSRQLLTSNVLIHHGDAPNIDFVAKIGGWVKNFGAVSGFGALSPPLAITAADLPMSIDVQPTAVTNPSQSTASASAAVPPRRTRPRQPRPPHTTQEGEAFLPRRQPRRVE
ncbi:hypothetical protein OUZ56_010607 [Daphnia magna]|uniref:Uncharacterized protein n=1 Tax=Daphnia magna TaxID=35525 RepID=A0ABR0AJ35_9CRUS|nr:hypothetical protein OUZ56_010607 [Daphnia magna]